MLMHPSMVSGVSPQLHLSRYTNLQRWNVTFLFYFSS